jgi:hypothetical protein
MRSNQAFPRLAAVTLLTGLGFLSTACGNLTIRTWVKVVEEESGGSVVVGDGELALATVQGGFLAVARLDTRNLLQPLPGTITLEDVRIAASEPELLRQVCVWGNPTLPSTGTMTVDILGGGGSTADITINLLATTFFTRNQPPVALSQPATFELGDGLSIDTLLAAQNSGSADGLFATEASFVGETTLGGLPVQFVLDLVISNDGTPPSFDADLLAFCGSRFEQQGRDLFFSVNSKSSYLLTADLDQTQPPLVIELADVGAAPGDVLRLRRIGTFADTTTLKDGKLTALAGVFSSNDTVLGMREEVRVPGAIDAGTDVSTGTVIHCELIIICLPTSTNIPQDFMIHPSVDVTVPAGATHLIAAPLSPGLLYRDNSGFGFGLSVEVLP